MNSSVLRQLRLTFVENKARKDEVLKEMEHLDDEMKRMAKRKEEILKDVDSINANLNSIHNNCDIVAHKLRDDLEQFTEITTNLSVILGRDSIQGLLEHALFNNDSSQDPSPAEPARTPSQDPSREPPADSIEGLLELAVFNNDSSQDPSRGPPAEPDRTPQDPSREPTAELNRRLSRDPSREPERTPQDPSRGPPAELNRRLSRDPSREPDRTPQDPSREPTAELNRRLSQDPPAELIRRLSITPSVEPAGTPSTRHSLRNQSKECFLQHQGQESRRKPRAAGKKRGRIDKESNDTQRRFIAGSYQEHSHALPPKKKVGRPRKSAMGNLIHSLSNK